eukprot:4678819-Pyramimonas_sp.AAC.1
MKKPVRRARRMARRTLKGKVKGLSKGKGIALATTRQRHARIPSAGRGRRHAPGKGKGRRGNPKDAN